MTFADSLASLCSKEAIAAKNDPQRLAEMIERITHSLAFTISIATPDEAAAQALLTGVENQLYVYVTGSGPLRTEINPANADGQPDEAQEWRDYDPDC